MTRLYPLKFIPIYKNTIWGGAKIKAFKGIASGGDNEIIGESWELSGVKGDESIVENGTLAGKSITELLREYKGKLIGTKNYERFGEEFPLLTKFIDAQDDLSIQVHPDDILSQKRHGKRGKTELWYVIDADKGAKLRIGFNQEITPTEYEQRVKNNTITEVVREYDIKSGDLFFLPPGSIHSIGAGCFIAEIQQTSDVTYRIYDFSRKDANGKERELHTELSKEAIDYTYRNSYKCNYVKQKNSGVKLASCDYFTTYFYDLDSELECNYSKLDSFITIMCVDGECDVIDDNREKITIKQGESLLLGAETTNIKIKPKNSVKLIISYID